MIHRLGLLVAASVAAAYVVKTLKPSEHGQEFDDRVQNEGGDTTQDDGLQDMWGSLPRDILVLIARRIEFFEDFCKFSSVCKTWHSVTLILGKFQTLPSRFPWIMLTDKAEINYPKVSCHNSLNDISVMLINEVRKNEQIEGMHNRQFYSFAASKVYEFELPEATRKKCFGLGYGLLLTLDYDLQINILNPFTRQQIGLPDMLSFKRHYNYDYQNRSPQHFIDYFIVKAAISSNPYKLSNQDCIIMAIYGTCQALAFARPGDRVWTDVHHAREMSYTDVVYCNGKFYVVDTQGIIEVCDINDANESKVTPIACLPKHTYYKEYHKYYCGYDRKKTHDEYPKYLVELSGDLLLLIRFRNGEYYDDKVDISRPYNHTVGFLIFKLEEFGGDYPYKLTKVKNLGNNALFIGSNASVSVPSSRCVKANSIYFSDEDTMANNLQPYGGGYDTGVYDVKSCKISLFSLHDYSSRFMSLLTPPMWIIS